MRFNSEKILNFPADSYSLNFCSYIKYTGNAETILNHFVMVFDPSGIYLAQRKLTQIQFPAHSCPKLRQQDQKITELSVAERIFYPVAGGSHQLCKQRIED